MPPDELFDDVEKLFALLFPHKVLLVLQCQTLADLHPPGMLFELQRLLFLFTPHSFRLFRNRAEAAGSGIDEQAMQGIRVVECADQLHLHRIEVGQTALQVDQLPLLDAMKLLLCSKDAA